jgi:iron complex transport system substrate-binding protein
MQRTVTIIIVISLLFFLLLSGCAEKMSPGLPEKELTAIPETGLTNVSVIDSYGREVQLAQEINRIAALYSFAGYAVSLLGRGSDLVAVPDGLQRDVLLRKMIPEVADAAVPRAAGKINIEELLRIEPDLVIIRGDTAADKKELEKLDKSGLPYIIVEYSNIAEQQKAISIIGEAIGRAEEAKAYNNYYNKVVGLVSEAVDKIPLEERVRLYHSENQVTRTIPAHSLPADFSKVAGVINVSINEPLNLIDNDYYASLEQILLWNPEVIIANENTALAYILGNPQLSGIEAVQNKRVYKLPQGISRWGHSGSVESPLAVLWIAKTVYPDLLEHVNLEKEVQFFYRTFFNYNLNADGVEQILSGKDLRDQK